MRAQLDCAVAESRSHKTMKTKIILLAALMVSLTSIGVAQAQARITPDTVVRNLYAARKRPVTDPFFQTKSRARLNKYFTKDLGDLIWKDAVASSKSNEVGALDGDP